MDNLKILAATYEWINPVTPGIRLELELETPEGSKRVVATVSEVRPQLFNNGLVYLQGTSPSHAELLRNYLTPKEIHEHPGEFMDSVTNNPGILDLVRLFLDAIDYRNGARFEEHASLF
jgi:hypothetical protein